MQAVVSKLVPKPSRATGFGIFDGSFGIFWFLGSWLIGVLYDVSVPLMVVVATAVQLAAIPVYLRIGAVTPSQCPHGGSNPGPTD